MKLTNDIKQKIDDYFDNITPERLLELSLDLYSFKEYEDYELDNQKFNTQSTEIYSSQKNNSSFDLSSNSTMPFAA